MQSVFILFSPLSGGNIQLYLAEVLLSLLQYKDLL